MPNKQTKIKPLSLSKTFLNSGKIIKKTWPELLLIIFIVSSVVIAVLFLLMLIYVLLVKYNVLQVSYFFTFNLIWQTLSYIIFMIIAAVAQIMIIQQLLTPEMKFNNIFKSIATHFLPFFCLTIAINLIFLIASLPLYISVFLFLLNKIIFCIISSIIGIILTILFASYFIFSPFILIDEKKSCLSSLRASVSLANKNLPNLIYKLIILAIIFVILDGFALIILPVAYVGKILASIIFLIMIIFTFAYLLALYQEFKD